jgi:SAM-dependent methyltransferase
MAKTTAELGRSAKGVRDLSLKDQAPDCDIAINGKPRLVGWSDLKPGALVVDVGCGQGASRARFETAGARWIGIEPFNGGSHTVQASGEALPFADESVDLVYSNAVLEHVPDVAKAFQETARTLKPGGLFVGYVAFMECFHEISYSHLSFKALESYANQNGMVLEELSGGRGFGIDYHLRVLLHPLPTRPVQQFIRRSIRGTIRLKSWVGYFGLRIGRRSSHRSARELSALYYQVECLRQSHGFSFRIRKLD